MVAPSGPGGAGGPPAAGRPAGRTGGLRTLLRTALALCWRPVRVIRAWRGDGADRPTSPGMYLALSLVLALVADRMVYVGLGAEALFSPQERAIRAHSPLLRHASLLALLLLPATAALLRLAFAGSRLRYADALVAMAYLQAQVNLFLLALPLWHATLGRGLIDPAAAIGTLAWMLWAWTGLIDAPAWRRWLGALLTLVLGQALNLVAVGLVLWASARPGV